MRILLIEDDDLVRTSLSSFIETVLGHEVTGFNSAEKGLEVLKKQTFPLIITDLFLPGITGMQFIRKVKKLSRKHTEFVLISGTGDQTTEDEAAKEGILYLRKPFDINNIVQLMERITRSDDAGALPDDAGGQ